MATRAWHVRQLRKMSPAVNTARAVGAYLLLVCTYGVTWLVAVAGRRIPRRAWKPTGRIMAAGTFHNPNWYLSHMIPLTRSGVKEVILLVDEPHLPLEGVHVVCWPRWMSRLLGRPVARAIWALIAGIWHRPDLYMGYHLGPGACTMLMVGRLMGRPACYQMTGGPVEIIGGGVHAAEGIGAPLGSPSRLIERMALAVVRQYDLVVVRGSKAREFLIAHGIMQSVAVITGSVQESRSLHTNGGRDIHIVFVGRLSVVKQADQVIAIVEAVKRAIPAVRAAIIGAGPLMGDLQAYAEKLGVAPNIEFLGKQTDIEPFLVRSKVFVLTSRSEGLSIAMAEAMCAGVVPVVANVGDLADLVVEGVNGHLIEPNRIDEYVRRIVFLLQNEPTWAQFSRSAMESARAQCDIAVVSERWRRHLHSTILRASGCRSQEVAT